MIEHLPTRPGQDPWITLLRSLIGVCFLGLVLIQPSGEGWGRSWNLIAYWIYSAPIALVLGALYLGRRRRRKVPSQRLDQAFLTAAFLYPVISLVAIKLKA